MPTHFTKDPLVRRIDPTPGVVGPPESSLVKLPGVLTCHPTTGQRVGFHPRWRSDNHLHPSQTGTTLEQGTDDGRRAIPRIHYLTLLTESSFPPPLGTCTATRLEALPGEWAVSGMGLKQPHSRNGGWIDRDSIRAWRSQLDRACHGQPRCSPAFQRWPTQPCWPQPWSRGSCWPRPPASASRGWDNVP